MIALLFLGFLSIGDAPAAPAKIHLSLQNVVERVVKDSDRKVELNLERFQADVLTSRERRKYQWGIGLDVNYTDTEAENLQGFADLQQRQFFSGIGVQKRFTTGSLTTLKYERTNLARVLGGFSQQIGLPSEQTQDLLTFEFTQNLWQNAFGLIDRLEMSKAETEVSRAELKRIEDLECHLLDVMKMYWDTYVAKESLEEAIQARERYTKLLLTVRRKSKLNFSAPGELERTKAEFEVRQQTVKLRSQNYLQMLDRLLNELNIPLETEVELDINDNLPAVPNPPPFKIEELRSLKIIKNQIENAERDIRIQQSKSDAELDFVGRVQSTGVEREADLALSEMTEFDHPTYYAGVSLRFLLDSSETEAEVRNARLQKQLYDLEFKKVLEQAKADMRHLERRVQTTFLIAESKIRALDSRKKALKQIKRAYDQGRVDLSELIDADNSLSLAQTEKISAVGDYQIALNEWAALRDSLVK